ncbi:MAG: response regulator [Patescibacteria group bacterium]
MKKILIVEDDTILLDALAGQFGSDEYKALTAPDGKVGLEVALKEHPDLILLDLLMPVMDGMAMLGKLREDAWGKTAVVFVLTNYDTEERVAGAMALGCEQYLVKSNLKLSEIVEKVANRLGK